MAMRIIVAAIICFVSISSFSVASCLDDGMLGYMDKSAPEVSVLAFPQCVRANQCSIAKKELEKVKKYDDVKYSFLKGCALANGDCFKQDLLEAERLLTSCSKRSYTCKIALFNLYSFYGEDPRNYEQFALELANNRYIGAYGFLADLYGSRGTTEGIAYGYFWGKLVLMDFEAQLRGHDRFEYDNKAYIAPDVKRRQQLLSDIENVSSLLKRFEYQLPKGVVVKIDNICFRYMYDVSPKNKADAGSFTEKDPLSGIADVYGVYIQNTTGAIKSKQKIHSAPSKIPKPDRIQEYENSVLALLG